VTDDAYRLPRCVLPSRYDVELAPELTESRFDGTVRIEIDVTTATDEIVMNAADLVVHETRLSQVLSSGTRDLDITGVRLDDALERLVIEVMLEPGTYVIHINFSGTLNDRLRGFYRSTYRNDDGELEVIATTQMQPADCRRAFPCFDEPDLKAVFGITLVVDPGLTAISNSAERSRTPRHGGLIAITFEDTIPMSSYLVAMVVGRLQVCDAVDVNGIPLRVVHVPGKANLVPFGLDAARSCLAWFQDYYGIPYPGQKIDLVALPDFAAGAMENLGCITFRESLLLVDPLTSTQIEQQNVVDVVAHELAHMWFGDLVTMRWWNGIWLNEAFATFMEIEACAAYRPDWERWTSFALERTAAFETDALASTRTVEYEVHSPADSEGMFDVLTYQKGGALLRMLQQYLGEDVFRDGVRRYLAQHSYGNTEADDLWAALGWASGAPVGTIMDSWIWQRGFPLVRVRQSGSALELSQERFAFSEDAVLDPTVWAVPVQVRQWVGGAIREDKVLLDGRSATVELLDRDATVVVNAGGHGFYRVAYDHQLRRRLDSTALSELSTIERYCLIDDAWAAVTAGHLEASEFLALAQGFAGERDQAVWQGLAMALRACGRLVDGDALDAFRSRVSTIARPALDDLGWSAQTGEGDLRRKLRGLLISVSAVLARDVDSVERSRELFHQMQHGTTIDADVAAAVTAVVGALGSEREYELFQDKFRDATTPQEQLRYLYGLAEFPEASLVRRTCEFAFSDEVKSQNAPFLLARCIANRDHGADAWSYVRERWNDANSRFPSNTIVRMIDPVKLLNQPHVAADVQAFFAEHPIPQSTTTLQQVLERQRVNVALRAREEHRLGAALIAAP
jgi:puromycin-sensitive aminopeptidase